MRDPRPISQPSEFENGTKLGYRRSKLRGICSENLLVILIVIAILNTHDRNARTNKNVSRNGNNRKEWYKS